MTPWSSYGMLWSEGTAASTTDDARSHLLGFMIRQIPSDAKLSDEVALDALKAAVPQPVVEAVVADFGLRAERQRKLPTEVTMLLVITMNLFTRQSLQQVLIKMLKGLRLVWPDPSFATATKGAICQARYRLGARPIVELFHRVCRPMASQATRGAFLFGRRVMALDTTFEDVPDTPENARAFGRHWTDRGPSAFPQVQAVYLEECGTHAIIDAGFWPCHANQHAAAQRLLRSVGPGMLLTWDSGLHSFEIASKTRVRDAHFLGRVPAGAKFTPILNLTDGSYLAYIYPGDRRRRRRGEHLLVRIIEYTLTDPNRPGYGQVHRLMTSLLDANECPALELICAYHERWEIEITIDEIDTHQRLPLHPLRSKKPVGVIQELYGLLIAHYAVRRVMHDCAIEHDIDPDRLSFTNAVELVCDAIHEFQTVARQDHPTLYQRLLGDIGRHRLPERANRTNPRVVKRKMSKFPLKRPRHRRWPQPTMTFREAVAMLN
jgi:Insertion element 4 transposase N-terminal/Transposase DDE domain